MRKKPPCPDTFASCLYLKALGARGLERRLRRRLLFGGALRLYVHPLLMYACVIA